VAEKQYGETKTMQLLSQLSKQDNAFSQTCFGHWIW